MRLKPEQVGDHLRQGLTPVWLVSGDEPLQVMEIVDAVRAKARAEGYDEREVFDADARFDWAQLAASSSTLSLFATRRIIEVRMTAKAGKAGAQTLEDWTANPPPDTLLLVTCGKLDKREAGARWVKALDGAGVFVQVWPVGAGEMEGWIARRLRSHGLEPGLDVARLLAERVEGNLLAAAQEIDKLLLLNGQGRIEVDAVVEAVADSVRYNIFDLAEAAVTGDAARAARVLRGLDAEGEEPVLVLWALAREVRSLAKAAEEGNGDRAFFGPPARVAALKAALRRRSPVAWRRLLARCARADRVVKGQAPGRTWDELLALVTAIAGKGQMRA